MVKLVLIFLISLSCVRAKVPDMEGLCLNDQCEDTSTTKGSGTVFDNFNVAGDCINCLLGSDIGDPNAVISCKVSGCYHDGRDHEFARFSSSTLKVLAKPICDNPTAERVDKLKIGCKIEHSITTDAFDIKYFDLRATPKFLLESTRLCLHITYDSSKLVDQHTNEETTSHKITMESHLRATCKNDGADRMIVFEFGGSQQI